MQNTNLFRMIFGILLFGSSGFLLASEADKIQEQAKAMRQKASAIAQHGKQEAELGNKEQAERLKKESIKMLEAAEKMALKSRHTELPLELHAHAENLEAASRRIHHLKVAAENLKMAEVHDLASDLMQKAGAMERDVQEGRKRLDAEIQKRHGKEHGPEHAPDIVQELKREIEHLRAEVKELRQKLEQR